MGSVAIAVGVGAALAGGTAAYQAHEQRKQEKKIRKRQEAAERRAALLQEAQEQINLQEQRRARLARAPVLGTEIEVGEESIFGESLTTEALARKEPAIQGVQLGGAAVSGVQI